MNAAQINEQKALALKLLDWHGGQSCPLYAIGSCMLSDSDHNKEYLPKNHKGHSEALPKAINTLLRMKQDAKFPDSITPQDEKNLAKLVYELNKYL